MAAPPPPPPSHVVLLSAILWSGLLMAVTEAEERDGR